MQFFFFQTDFMSVCFSSFSSAASFARSSEHLFRLRRARIVCMEGKELQQLPKTGMIGFKEIRFSSSTEADKPLKECKFTAFYLHGLLGSGEELTDFSHSLASSLSNLSVSDWRMVLVDLRNHGSSVGREGLSPPHDMVNAARDLANLVKSLNWAWPDIVIGHSLGAKVALQYVLSCSQGDYGASAQSPKQLWLLDGAPGAFKFTGIFEEMERALHTVETLPSQIPSHEWLVNHMIDLGYSKRVGERLADTLKKSGEYEILPFNAYGAVRMFTSARDMDYWEFVEHPPKGMEVAFVRTEMWVEQVVERLERIAARESDESTGKVSVHVVPNSGHWIHKDQPERLLEIMTPKIASLAQAKS